MENPGRWSRFSTRTTSRVGVAIDSLEDMEILFEGIPLGEVSTSMTINATASMLLAMYMVAAEKQGVGPDKIQGTVQNDLLKEFIARGTYIFPPRDSVKITIDIMEYCRDSIPKWNPISVSGYHMREAGSTAVQEVAFTLADGIEYLGHAKARGLDIEKIAERVSFFFAVHNNFLEEVAKFRAARRLWARTMKERFKVVDDRACMLRFHSQTSGVTLTPKQPRNNIIRVTIQALAAALGGTQSLHTNSFDEALALPSEEAATIALRTQQVIAYESGAGDTIDPLAGSYCIEALTNKIEEESIKYIEQIHKINPEIEAIKRERLKELRSKRDNDKVKVDLRRLEEAARGNENLMPFIVETVRDYATIGEMSMTLERVYGRYRGSGKTATG